MARVTWHLTSSGPLPAIAKGTHVIIPSVADLEDDRWEAKVVKQDGNRIKLSVNSPPTAVIGRYQLTVETACASGQAVSKHNPANDIYMLFNPWCEGTETSLNASSRSSAVKNVDGRMTSLKSGVVYCVVFFFLVNQLFALWQQIKWEDWLWSFELFELDQRGVHLVSLQRSSNFQMSLLHNSEWRNKQIKQTAHFYFVFSLCVFNCFLFLCLSAEANLYFTEMMYWSPHRPLEKRNKYIQKRSHKGCNILIFRYFR